MSDKKCTYCGEPVADSCYPRHRIILEDESDTDPNHRVETRLCQDCWEELQAQL